MLVKSMMLPVYQTHNHVCFVVYEFYRILAEML